MNTPSSNFLVFTRDQLARQAIEALLAQRLCSQFEIESGKLSCERIKKKRFSHILLDQADISLNDVSFIRKNQKDAEIILITLNSEHSELNHFSHFGVDGFLKNRWPMKSSSLRSVELKNYRITPKPGGSTAMSARWSKKISLSP